MPIPRLTLFGLASAKNASDTLMIGSIGAVSSAASGDELIVSVLNSNAEATGFNLIEQYLTRLSRQVARLTANSQVYKVCSAPGAITSLERLPTFDACV
jgi:hypothetical protein